MVFHLYAGDDNNISINFFNQKNHHYFVHIVSLDLYSYLTLILDIIQSL